MMVELSIFGNILILHTTIRAITDTYGTGLDISNPNAVDLSKINLTGTIHLIILSLQIMYVLMHLQL